MRPRSYFLLPVLLFFIFALLASGPAQAEDVVLTVPTDYPTIQSALDAAEDLASTYTGTTYKVFVERGTYNESLTLKNNINLEGRETARTIIAGGGTETLVIADNVSASIRKFTFLNAAVGIQVQNSSDLTIQNNVFIVGSGGTAIQVQSSSSTSITNNTFYQNGAAISRDADIEIVNNIFSNNGTAINMPTAFTGIKYNLFYSNTTDGPTGSNSIPDTTHPDANPLFVAPSSPLYDFHVKQGSPAIDTGDSALNDVIDTTSTGVSTRSDIGAYGGSNADAYPFPVQDLTGSASSDTSILLTWSANNSYLVTNTSDPGWYKAYYSLNVHEAGDVYTYETGTVTDTSILISGLTPTVTEPSTPTNIDTSPLDGKIVVTWSAVDGATGYYIHYGINSIDENDPIPVKNATTHTIEGLTNYQDYMIAVSAYAQATYYVAVTAIDNTDSMHESDYSSEISVGVGPELESANSEIVTDYPEPVVPYPNLKNEGCFIATAAFGHYSAPQVQALRAFRDRYLKTNSWGRAFVSWYYKTSPALAGFINGHPALKPLVRAALAPAVLFSIVMTESNIILWAAAFFCLVPMAFLAIRRKKDHNAAGMLKTFFLILAIAAFQPLAAHAQEGAESRPHWSLELKGGHIVPELDDWFKYYGKRDAGHYAASLAYKIIQQVEVGIEGGYIRISGKAAALSHGYYTGLVTYKVMPLNAFVTFRAMFSDTQWIVPYIGGGWTRMYYSQAVKDQSTARGSADGTHVKAGLQLLLDEIDPTAATSMYLDYGVYHTYLFIETQRTRVMADSASLGQVDLGGISYFAGFLLEF